MNWIKTSDALPPEIEFGVTATVLVHFANAGECEFDVANYDHEAKHWSLPTRGFSHPDCDPDHWSFIDPVPAHFEQRRAA